MPKVTIRTVEDAEAGFARAVDRVLRRDEWLHEEGVDPDLITSDIGRIAMVNTARQYALDLTVAYSLGQQEEPLQTAL
jgi:hypothetical protein